MDRCSGNNLCYGVVFSLDDGQGQCLSRGSACSDITISDWTGGSFYSCMKGNSSSLCLRNTSL